VVSGPGGSLIPDTQVTAAEQGTGFIRSSRNLQDGSDHRSLLPRGRNHVEAAKDGFETLSQGSITLLVNSHLKIDSHMSVGAQTTTVPSSAENRGASSSRQLISFGFVTFMGRQYSDF
jgi:hypothetical protein